MESKYHDAQSIKKWRLGLQVGSVWSEQGHALLTALPARTAAGTGGKAIRAMQEGIFQVLGKHWLNKRNNKRTYKRDTEFKETGLVGAGIGWSLFVENFLSTIPTILKLASLGRWK